MMESESRVMGICSEYSGVIGFLGGGRRPAPLTDEEVDSIVNQLEEKKKLLLQVMFEPNETIKVTDGHVYEFWWIIEEVDPERGNSKDICVHFWRTAPVELEYWQVERVSD